MLHTLLIDTPSHTFDDSLSLSFLLIQTLMSFIVATSSLSSHYWSLCLCVKVPYAMLTSRPCAAYNSVTCFPHYTLSLTVNWFLSLSSSFLGKKNQRRLCTAAKKALEKIPTKTLRSSDLQSNAAAATSLHGEFMECCAVCIESFKPADLVRILPCK